MAIFLVMLTFGSPLFATTMVSPDGRCSLDFPDDWLRQPGDEFVRCEYDLKNIYGVILNGTTDIDSQPLGPDCPCLQSYKHQLEVAGVYNLAYGTITAGDHTFYTISGVSSNAYYLAGDYYICTAFAQAHDRVYSIHCTAKMSAVPSGYIITQDPIIVKIVQSYREIVKSIGDAHVNSEAKLQTIHMAEASLNAPGNWTLSPNQVGLFSPNRDLMLTLSVNRNPKHMGPFDPSISQSTDEVASRDHMVLLNKQYTTVHGITWFTSTSESHIFGSETAIVWANTTTTPDYIYTFIASKSFVFDPGLNVGDMSRYPELQAAFESFRLTPATDASGTSQAISANQSSPQSASSTTKPFSVAGFNSTIFNQVTTLICAVFILIIMLVVVLVFMPRPQVKKKSQGLPLKSAPPMK